MKFKQKKLNTVKQLLERHVLIIYRSIGLPKEHIRGILHIREVILQIKRKLRSHCYHLAQG